GPSSLPAEPDGCDDESRNMLVRMEPAPLETPVQAVRAYAYKIPTDKAEADGTYAWESTTIVLAEVLAGGQTGIGYSYTNKAVAALIAETLCDVVRRFDAFDPPAAWRAMFTAVRNMGRDGLAATAISAVDTAMWDLKAK